MSLSTAEYFDSLPGGAEAYPACRVRGGATAVRELIELCGEDELQALMPESISVASLRRIPNTYWIQQVHWYGLMHAVRDLGFGGDNGRFEAHARTQMSAMLEQPAMRALLWLCTPKMTVKATPRLFQLSYRGVSMSASRETPGRVDYTLVHPPHLIDGLVGGMFAATTETVLAVGGGASAQVQRLELHVEKERTRFALRVEP